MALIKLGHNADNLELNLTAETCATHGVILVVQLGNYGLSNARSALATGALRGDRLDAPMRYCPLQQFRRWCVM